MAPQNQKSGQTKKKVKCPKCGKRHLGKCRAQSVNLQKSMPKPTKTKLTKKSVSDSISGASGETVDTTGKEPTNSYQVYLGPVSGIPDDPYGVKFFQSFNPLTLAKLADHTLLKKTAEAYKFYKVTACKMRLEPVVSDTAVLGTSWALGLWRDPGSTGPTSFNLALQNGKGAQTGKRCVHPIKPTTERWFNVVPSEEVREDSPGAMYVSAVGKTMALGGNKWTGPVFHLYVDIHYKWSVVCNNDGLVYQSITVAEIAGDVKSEVVDGKKVLTITPSPGSERSLLFSLPPGRAKNGESLGKIIYRLAGAVGTVAAALPPPWDTIVPAGCWFIRLLIGDSNSTTPRAVIYPSYVEAKEQEGEFNGDLKSTPFVFSGPVEQISDFEPPLGNVLGPNPIDPANNPWAEYGVDWWPEKYGTYHAQFLWYIPGNGPLVQNASNFAVSEETTVTYGLDKLEWSKSRGGAETTAVVQRQAAIRATAPAEEKTFALKISDFTTGKHLATWGFDTIVRNLQAGKSSGQVNYQGSPYQALIIAVGEAGQYKVNPQMEFSNNEGLAPSTVFCFGVDLIGNQYVWVKDENPGGSDKNQWFWDVGSIQLNSRPATKQEEMLKLAKKIEDLEERAMMLRLENRERSLLRELQDMQPSESESEPESGNGTEDEELE